jgi:hypothetical protein
MKLATTPYLFLPANRVWRPYLNTRPQAPPYAGVSKYHTVGFKGPPFNGCSNGLRCSGTSTFSRRACPPCRTCFQRGWQARRLNILPILTTKDYCAPIQHTGRALGRWVRPGATQMSRPEPIFRPTHPRWWGRRRPFYLSPPRCPPPMARAAESGQGEKGKTGRAGVQSPNLQPVSLSSETQRESDGDGHLAHLGICQCCR